MKKLLLALILSSPALAHAQAPTQSCPAGGAISAAVINMGASCTTFTGTVGTDIVKTAQSATLGSQTICDTSSTCPAGLVTVLINITPNATGLTLSSVAPTISFTDPVSAKTNLALTSTAGSPILSLLTSTPGAYVFFFYHVANTAITVNTTFVAGTGTPSYNFYSRLLW